MDEAAANYAGRMIEDGKVLDDFIEKHRDNRTLLEKVRDAIRSIIASDALVNREAETIRFRLKPGKVLLFDSKTEERIPFTAE